MLTITKPTPEQVDGYAASLCVFVGPQLRRDARLLLPHLEPWAAVRAILRLAPMEGEARRAAAVALFDQ